MLPDDFIPKMIEMFTARFIREMINAELIIHKDMGIVGDAYVSEIKVGDSDAKTSFSVKIAALAESGIPGAVQMRIGEDVRVIKKLLIKELML